MRRSFASRLLRWFDRHGRRDLPWQRPRSAYRVWVSEVMLQQTQVATVIPYFRKFVQHFPTVRALAAAPPDDVLALWSGLGYYARARNLHRAAQIIVEKHSGRFPQDLEAVAALPGIGRSTAGAILAQAYGQAHAILDGNVKRVLARHAAVPGFPGDTAVQKKLWVQSERRLPHVRLADYTQAIMDLGATVCLARAPRCGDCPLRADCKAQLAGRVARYPAPRPRRSRPLKQAQLLLARNDAGAILLERRAPAGIWGGLWCPPMVDHGADWRASLHRYGVSARAHEALPVLRHGFSHFTLDLRPLQLRATASGVAEDGFAWVTLDQALGLGLPAPVRKLLESLQPPACHPER